MKKNYIALAQLILILIFVSILAAFGATYVQTSDTITLTWANVSPASGSAVVKCSSVASNGAFVGVALTGSTTANASIRVALTGVYDLPVTASYTLGNIATGDFVWTTTTGAGTATTRLSNASSGILFGQALQSVIASTNADVFATVSVLLRQPVPK